MNALTQAPAVTPGQWLASLAFLGVGIVATSQARAAMRTHRSAIPSDVCRPYVFDAQAVDKRIAHYIDAGERDPSLIAVNVATELYGRHPSGHGVTFPPGRDAKSEVQCVFGNVIASVDRAFVARGIDPEDQAKLEDGVVWRTVRASSGSPDLAQYPWNFPALNEGNRPAPSTFYLAAEGDIGSTFFKTALASALEMAGVDSSVAYDNNSKVGKRLRRELRDLTLCAPFNDARITSTSATKAGGRDPGTNGPNDAGVTYMMGPHGRGIVWLPRHYDDLARLAQGMSPKRGVTSSGEVLGSGRSFPLIWIPAINLELLRGPMPVVSTEGMAWADTDRSTLHPPTAVDKLGVDQSGVALPGGLGCQPAEGPWG